MIRPALIKPGEEMLLANVHAAAGQASAETEKIAARFWLQDITDTTELYDIVDGVAIIGVKGVLLDELPFGGSEYATGYNVLEMQAARAFADPRVRGVALDITSGGGMCDGCFELVEFLHEAKGEAKKPLAAIVNSYAFSAAYAIASAADSISCPKTGGVGSIGVVMVHLDMSGWLEQIGLKPSLIFSGKHKVDGNPYEALPKPVRAEFQATTDELREIFAEAVAKGRGQAGIDKKRALATEAACYERPSKIDEALKLGLIDAVIPAEDALAQLIEAVAP